MSKLTFSHHLKWRLSDISVLTMRNLRHFRQVPEALMDVTIQPIMFVLLFAFVFGGVIHISDGNYREYLLGGILCQTLAFGMAGPGIALASDLKEGIVDRFRSMSIARSTFLLGHFTSGLLTRILAVAVLCASGLLIGWTIHSNVGSAVVAFAILALLICAMVWLGMLFGTVVRTPDAVMGIAAMVIFPLTFLSCAFVPIEGLSKSLQPIAKYNPISCVATAVRTLFGNPSALPENPGWMLNHPVLSSILWCTAIIAVAMPLAIWRYRVRTTE